MKRNRNDVTVTLPKETLPTIAGALEPKLPTQSAPTLSQMLENLESLLHDLHAYRNGVLDRL